MQCELFFKNGKMENKMYILEPLFEKAENYAKSSFELYKLKTIKKSANIISTIVSRGIAIILFSILIITVSIGAALWLGDLLGKSYYGFFCVAGFYVVLGTLVYFFLHNCIKKWVSNSIVSQLLD